MTKVILITGLVDDARDGLVARAEKYNLSPGWTLLSYVAEAVTLAATDGVELLQECLGTFVRLLEASVASVLPQLGLLDELPEPPCHCSFIALPSPDDGTVVLVANGVSVGVVFLLLSLLLGNIDTDSVSV